MSTENMFALYSSSVNSVFQLGLESWPATIPIVNAFGIFWIDAIEDPWLKEWLMVWWLACWSLNREKLGVQISARVENSRLHWWHTVCGKMRWR